MRNSLFFISILVVGLTIEHMGQLVLGIPIFIVIPSIIVWLAISERLKRDILLTSLAIFSYSLVYGLPVLFTMSIFLLMVAIIVRIKQSLKIDREVSLPSILVVMGATGIYTLLYSFYVPFKFALYQLPITLAEALLSALAILLIIYVTGQIFPTTLRR